LKSETGSRRNLNIRKVAQKLDFYHIPEPWREHPSFTWRQLHEVEPSMVRFLLGAGMRLQGWLYLGG
jgi:hypothetical protein